METPNAVEFFKLCELEPKLKILASDIFKVIDDKTTTCFCANTIWYRRFKPRLVKLVGFDAGIIEEKEMPKTPHGFYHISEIMDFVKKNPPIRIKIDPKLTTIEAYDIAYRFLYEILPPCRNCGEPSMRTFK